MLELAPTLEKVRSLVFERDGYVCQYCGTEAAQNYVLEHIVPTRLDGPTQPYNLVVACRGCNISKGSTVWVPRNLAAITAGYPEWAAKVQELAVLCMDVPQKDWISKGVEWRPAQHRALKILAAQQGREFREVLEEAVAAYLATPPDA
jgi:hypothetical protein